MKIVSIMKHLPASTADSFGNAIINLLTMKKAFVNGFNKQMENKEEIIKNYEVAVKKLLDIKDIENEIVECQDDYQKIVKDIQMLVNENASTTQDQSDYQKQYNHLVEKYERINSRMIEIETEIMDKAARRLEMKEFINRIRNTEELLTQFDEELFLVTDEKIIIHADSKMLIVFKDGAKIELI